MHDTEDMPVDVDFDEDEPSFSDPEDFEDDVDDEELLGDLLREKPQEADGIDSVVVVDNVPQVGPERLEKLKNVIHKIFSKFGKITNEFYPTVDGPEGLTKGYIFLEYGAPTQALEAVKLTCSYKQHTFRVNVFTDFDKYMSISDEWETPEKQPFKDFGNMRHWMEDPDCRDQYSVIYESGERTAIFNNDAKDPIVSEERARWTETYVRWSPKGTYLATFHQRGIALWGGEKFKQIQRFSHQGVSLIDFSPCERYVVTFSPLMDTKEDPQAIIIWDILTGQKKRGFHCESSAHWPIFKWSHDGKFFARMTQDTLSIYETPSMGLLDKKSLKISGIKDFSWSPGDDIIAVCVSNPPSPLQGLLLVPRDFSWSPGTSPGPWQAVNIISRSGSLHQDKDIPARVTLMQLPSRQEIRVRNLFNVVDCKLHWQRQGDYLCYLELRLVKGVENRDRESDLCVKVDRTPKGTQYERGLACGHPDCTMMNMVEHYMASDVQWDLRTIPGDLCVLVEPCQSKASRELVDKRRSMMEDYRTYREAALQQHHEQKTARLQLRGGVDTDELDSNTDDWEEETIEFFINEEIIPLGE
ncbi:eukaryotic translation initiation factor 3 subunit B-like [Oncorhynchus masou masou]|uniref:eukaryotic translation initiation factor 3 subunit B-like n=1 Tax=Oncorhynchus masou masou TaxID=90313 RepID=UPI003182BB12